LPNGFDSYFNDVDSIFEQIVAALISPYYLYVRQQIQSRHFCQELHPFAALYIAKSLKPIDCPFLCLHQLIINLSDQIVSFLFTGTKEHAGVTFTILNCEGILIKIVVLVRRDVCSSVFEGHRYHKFLFSISSFTGNDQLSIQKIESSFDNISLISDDSYWFFKDKLDTRLRNDVRE
jgi:hypothetical protein